MFGAWERRRRLSAHVDAVDARSIAILELDMLAETLAVLICVTNATTPPARTVTNQSINEALKRCNLLKRALVERVKLHDALAQVKSLRFGRP